MEREMSFLTGILNRAVSIKQPFMCCVHVCVIVCAIVCVLHGMLEAVQV